MSQTTLSATVTAFHEGERLLEYLNAQQITQSKLAKQMGSTHQAINQQIRMPVLGRRIRQKLLTELGLSYSDFLHGNFTPLPHKTQGGQLNAYLRERGMSTSQLMQLLGKGRVQVNRYFRSETLSRSLRGKLAKALSVPEEAIFGLEEPIALSPQMDDEETSLSMLRRHLIEWRAQRDKLQARGASEQELAFCQYQIWHLELSLPAFRLSGAVTSSSSINS